MYSNISKLSFVFFHSPLLLSCLSFSLSFFPLVWDARQNDPPVLKLQHNNFASTSLLKLANKNNVSRAKRKPVSGVIRQQWQPEHLYSLFGTSVFGGYKNVSYIKRALIILNPSAGWSEPLVAAYVMKQVFMWCGTYDIKDSQRSNMGFFCWIWSDIKLVHHCLLVILSTVQGWIWKSQDVQHGLRGLNHDINSRICSSVELFKDFKSFLVKNEENK